MRVLYSIVAVMTVCVSCADDSPPQPPPPGTVFMDFRPSAGFFAAPFPSEHRRREGGGWRLDDLPDPRAADYLRAITSLAQDTDGFATTGGIYLTTTRPIDARTIPDLAASVADGASVFLTPLEGDDAVRGRVPLRITVRATDAPSGVANLLAAVPLQGVPLRAATRYAMVVTRRVRDVSGQALTASPTVRLLREGTPVPGLDARVTGIYRDALDTLSRGGVATDDIAGLAVFRTGDPTRALRSVLAHARAHTPMRVVDAPTPREVFDDFCVYEATLALSSWQQGTAPYSTTGGRWNLTANGTPTLPHEERARLVVTLPRRPMPAQGYPLVVFIRTGGGGDRPLVDRGVRAMAGGPVAIAGSGPAREFAREGFAGASWDGPHGGLRNVSRGDEQFLMFNVTNLGALRDNVRQSALEAAQLVDVLAGLRVDVSHCAGASAASNEARFDVSVLALMGHSMGASIAPLAAAFEPRYRAVILSGAGASWIENIVHKERPLAVRPFAELLLRYNLTGSRLATDDPYLTLLQWALESADVTVYGDALARTQHVLMLQGIVDRYILPPIANAGSLSLGLDLAGPARDEGDMRLMRFDPLSRLLPLRGLRVLTGAVRANQGDRLTRLVRQYLEDGVEDGHEVMFQTEAPKRDYRCFLRSLAQGTPMVPAPDARTCEP